MTDVPSGMTVRGLLHRLCGVAILTLGGTTSCMACYQERKGNPQDMASALEGCQRPLGDAEEQSFHQPSRQGVEDGPLYFREKLEYLALIWGTIVMAGDGFHLWYEVEWLKYFRSGLMPLPRTVHLYEAILATLAIIVWHFYSVIFDPEDLPDELGLDHRDHGEHEMKLEHGLELERIMAEERRGEGKNSKRSRWMARIRPILSPQSRRKAFPYGIWSAR